MMKKVFRPRGNGSDRVQTQADSGASCAAERHAASRAVFPRQHPGPGHRLHQRPGPERDALVESAVSTWTRFCAPQRGLQILGAEPAATGQRRHRGAASGIGRGRRSRPGERRRHQRSSGYVQCVPFHAPQSAKAGGASDYGAAGVLAGFAHAWGIFTQEQFGTTRFAGLHGWDADGKFIINGGIVGTNQFLLNGAPVSLTGSWQFSPNLDGVEEFRVLTNTYDAQYGRTGGGTVMTTLKSGTNAWHGNVFEYFHNSVLDANTTQNNQSDQPRGYASGYPVARRRTNISTPPTVLTIPACYRIFCPASATPPRRS